MVFSENPAFQCSQTIFISLYTKFITHISP